MKQDKPKQQETSIKERIDLSKKLEHLGVVNIDKRIYGKKKK